MLSKLSLARKITFSAHQTKKIQSVLSQNKRFFADQQSNVYGTVEPVKIDSSNSQERKELKQKIAKQPPTFMRLWYLLGVAGAVGATMYYLNEDDRYERKVEHVLKQISSHDQEVRRKGLQALDSCLFLEKRLFSGVTEIPQSKEYLIKEGVVDVLLEAFKEGDDDIKYKCAIWLLRLIPYEEARSGLLNNSNGLPVIFQVLRSKNSSSSLWLSTSAILLELASYPNTLTSYSTDINDISKMMYESSNAGVHPLSPLIGAKLNTILLNTHSTLSLLNNSNIQVLTSVPCQNALKSALNSVIPKEPSPLNPPDALLRGDNIVNLNALLNPLLFGVFGSVWGYLRWNASARLGGLNSQEVSKFVAKHNKVGRYVFLLLLLDPIAETLMAWPKQGLHLPYLENPVQIPSHISGYPVSTYVPIAESFLFLGSTLYAIRYQKYIVLPLTAAVLTAHWDQVHTFAKPYLEAAGIPDPVETLVKSAKQKLNK